MMLERVVQQEVEERQLQWRLRPQSAAAAVSSSLRLRLRVREYADQHLASNIRVQASPRLRGKLVRASLLLQSSHNSASTLFGKVKQTTGSASLKEWSKPLA